MAGTQLKGDSVSDFSAGPNLRDAAPKLALNESSDAWNVTFDERGDTDSRLGYAKDNSTLYGSPDKIVNEFWSGVLGLKVVQAGAKVFLSSAPATARHTFSTSAIITFAELNAVIFACHPADGVFSSTDGVTWTVLADVDAPTKPTCCCTWQNKLFVGDAKGKLSWSAVGDGLTWVSTDFNNIWEKDQLGLVALHIGSGENILGQPGLVVCKQESSYRVNDSATGAYTTIDATIGAAGPLAIIGVGAKVITISKRGICWWQEGTIGFTNASDRFFPLWQSGQLNFAQQSKWCAGRKQHRAIFSLTRAGSTDNDLALEFHPEQDWIAPRSDAMSCYATSNGNTEVLYGGSPTVSGQSYVIDSGGSDDGAAISWRFQTRWFVLNQGFNASLWQIRLHGRGTGTMTIRTDYASAGGTQRQFNLAGTSGITYDSGLKYDSGVSYAIPAFQETEALFGFDLCREFSLLFEGSTSSTVAAPQVLGHGTAPQVGAFGLSSIEWLYTPLELS